MDIEAVEATYARWAPFYDFTFGAVTGAGRRRAAAYLTARGGSVLEVGVGTGLALGLYGAGVRVTGVDYSLDMLAKAKERVRERKLSSVESLQQMDARQLTFPDNHFDSVAAMHMVSVVPEPERVVSEMARVCKPGGTVLIVNHFASEKGLLAFLERKSVRFEKVLGWNAEFEKSRVMGEPSLTVVQEGRLPPLGMMTFLAMQKAV